MLHKQEWTIEMQIWVDSRASRHSGRIIASTELLLVPCVHLRDLYSRYGLLIYENEVWHAGIGRRMGSARNNT